MCTVQYDLILPVWHWKGYTEGISLQTDMFAGPAKLYIGTFIVNLVAITTMLTIMVYDHMRLV